MAIRAQVYKWIPFPSPRASHRPRPGMTQQPYIHTITIIGVATATTMTDSGRPSFQ